MIRQKLRSYSNSMNSLECDISVGRGEKGEAFTFDDFTQEQLEALRGEKGEKGERGEAFTYNDFTPEQLESLKGDRGEKGDIGLQGEKGEAFTFEDFTQEQLESLKGDKGENGKNIELNKSESHIQYKHSGDEEWIDLVALDELKVKDEVINTLLSQIQELTDRITVLEENGVKPPEVKQPPTFIGLISPFKDISNITYADLDVDTVQKNIVSKPQSIYTHNSGTQFNKSCIIAIPKTFGDITGVVDGADISITGSYHWSEVTLDIPEIGIVEYIIGGNKKSQAYNNSSVVKWSLV